MQTPMDMAIAGLRTWQTQAQSAAVMGLRLAGLAGAWTLPPHEWARMVAEKQVVLARAGEKMTRAMVEGAAPVFVYRAGLEPFARAVTRNADRLSAANRDG
jgi:hypothetical protein